MTAPKKRLLTVSAVLLLLAVGSVALAAGVFPMTYLPGTDDPSASVPAEEEGTNGTPFVVSTEVPTRDGYEFVDYTLDTGLEPPKKASYTVRHRVLVKPYIVFEETFTDVYEGDHVLVLPLCEADMLDKYHEKTGKSEMYSEFLLVQINSQAVPGTYDENTPLEWDVSDGDIVDFFYLLSSVG